MITAAIVAMALAFSVVNVTRLCLDLGVTAWIAWLIGPSVDLSVIGLLTGIRFLSLHGYTDEQLARLNRFLRFCGLLTLALNTAGALWHRQYGTAAVDAIGPVLLIGWSEFGPWLLREINAVCPSAAPEPAAAERPQAASPRPRGPWCSRPGCWPAPGSWTPSTARRPAGPSPATTSAPACVSAGTGPAP